jgi:hypothetical protein
VGGVKEANLVEDQLRKQGLRADGAGVVKVAIAEMVGVVAEALALARGEAGLGFDPQEHGNVLIGVKTVGDKKWDHHDVGLGGVLVPFGDEGSFLHVSAQHFSVDAQFADAFHLAFGGESGVVVEVGAVSDDEKARLRGRNTGSHLCGPTKEQFVDALVVADGFAVFHAFASELGDGAFQLQFPGNDGAGEVALTDEIGDDINIVSIDHVEDLAETGFFFPESAVDLSEDALFEERFSVVEGGCAGVRIDGGTMAYDEEGTVGFGEHGRKVVGSRGERSKKGAASPRLRTERARKVSRTSKKAPDNVGASWFAEGTLL